MNSNLVDYSTIEELEEHFSQRISLLNDCLELKGLDSNQKSIFRGLESSVIELRNIYLQVKHLIKQGQNQLDEMKDLSKGMESLNERLDHMHKNFPPVLKPIPPETLRKEKIEDPVTPKVTKKVKEPAKIQYITLDEFKNIPFYMKGRLQYEHINKFIENFNKVIAAKYKLLSMPHKQMKPADYKKVQAMKLEVNDATKNCYFCTEENMKEFGNMKIDKSTNNYVTVLRHCKRIKQVRGPGPIMRYVIIQNN